MTGPTRLHQTPLAHLATFVVGFLALVASAASDPGTIAGWLAGLGIGLVLLAVGAIVVSLRLQAEERSWRQAAART